jgi:hypothetical protein
MIWIGTQHGFYQVGIHSGIWINMMLQGHKIIGFRDLDWDSDYLALMRMITMTCGAKSPTIAM